MGERVYIGLATTFHDPAIAIVGGDGRIRFAEATERYLQYKRGANCEPDTLMRMDGLLKDHCAPDDDIVAATSWGLRFTGLIEKMAARGHFSLDSIIEAGPGLNRSLVPETAERALISLLYGKQRTAGLGLLTNLHKAFGHTRLSLRRCQHHLCHAALGCWTSPFDEAVCVVADGMGEFGSMAVYRYRDGRIDELEHHNGRESLGYLYGLITELCGFDRERGEEWKVMGLAAYGRPDDQLLDLIRRLYRIEDDGQVRFADEATIRDAVAALRAHARPPEAPPLDAADLALAGQRAFAEIMTALLRRVEALGIARNLVLSGGCALNSSFNGEVLARTGFERLYVPSAPADDGNALGAALLAWHEDTGRVPPMAGGFTSPYLGTDIATAALDRAVAMGWTPRVRRPGGDLHREVAAMLAAGKLIGWARGRAEFGPRALGNRSILADPRPADAKDRINHRVKRREPYRPFAPAILHEHGPAYFEDYQAAPYMERTLRFRPAVAGQVPAVVHEDGTGRLQTVTAEWYPDFHRLVGAFHDLTGVPLVLNTSFNIMGKPILHGAEDALAMLYTTGLDAVVVGDYLIEK